MGKKNDIQNWYYDKYIVANVQKNILLIVSIILSICIFVALILIKYVYENKSVEPYLITIDDRTGQATIVESESKREFTSSEAIKESFVIKYVKLRESYNRASIVENENELRVLTSKQAYIVYTNDPKLSASYELRSMRSNDAEVKTIIRSITFTSDKIAEVKTIRKVVDGNGAELSVKYYNIIVIFDFFDLELPLEDRYINPLGFQVVSYSTMEEKVAEGYDPTKNDR